MCFKAKPCKKRCNLTNEPQVPTAGSDFKWMSVTKNPRFDREHKVVPHPLTTCRRTFMLHLCLRSHLWRVLGAKQPFDPIDDDRANSWFPHVYCIRNKTAADGQNCHKTLVQGEGIPRLFHAPMLERDYRVFDGEDLVIRALFH